MEINELQCAAVALGILSLKLIPTWNSCNLGMYDFGEEEIVRLIYTCNWTVFVLSETYIALYTLGLYHKGKFNLPSLILILFGISTGTYIEMISFSLLSIEEAISLKYLHGLKMMSNIQGLELSLYLHRNEHNGVIILGSQNPCWQFA